VVHGSRECHAWPSRAVQQINGNVVALQAWMFEPVKLQKRTITPEGMTWNVPLSAGKDPHSPAKPPLPACLQTEVAMNRPTTANNSWQVARPTLAQLGCGSWSGSSKGGRPWITSCVPLRGGANRLLTTLLSNWALSSNL